MKLGANLRGFLAVCAVVIGAAALPAAPAWANVRSQTLYARGLIPFDRKQWDPAYRLFDEAVRADASDAVALYYRGLTQARRGQRSAAIKDIEQALQLDPKLPHAALDLGIAYFDEAQYAPAKSWLERAYQQGAERFTAAFFLGLTGYRTGDDAAAQKYLTEAKTDPDLRASAEYYAGLALLRQGKTDAGRAELQQVAREQPQSEIGKAAQRAASGTAARQPPATDPAGSEKPWSIYGEAGFQYDSNVILAPNDSGLKVLQSLPSESDGRAVIALGGGYTFLDTQFGSLRGQYDFYQSVHFRLTEFDLQGHRVRLDAAAPQGTLTYGISGTYDFYALDYQSFYQEALGTPWIAVAEGDAAATQAYYTIRGRDFFRKPYDPARNSINSAAGVRQYLDLGPLGPGDDWLLNFGYQFDAEDTVANSSGARDFQYKGNQADIGVTFPILTFAHAQLAYLFRLEDYQFPNSRAAFQVRRHDSEHQFVVALARDLTSHIRAEIDYIGVVNNSNIANFDYDRNIVSASVRVTF